MTSSVMQQCALNIVLYGHVLEKVEILHIWKILVQEYLIKNKDHYLRCKDKTKKTYDILRHIRLHMSKYQSDNEDLQSVISNLRPNCCLKVDFQKVDQHTGGKWLIHHTKRRSDNKLQSLKLTSRIS